jgi:hypothetical protein
MPQPSFVPRFTLMLAGSVLLFFLISLVYSWPVMMQPIPADAPPEFITEQVRQHMAGKTIPIFMVSLLLTALLVARPWKK